jgi:hypothetical protein
MTYDPKRTRPAHPPSPEEAAAPVDALLGAALVAPANEPAAPVHDAATHVDAARLAPGPAGGAGRGILTPPGAERAAIRALWLPVAGVLALVVLAVWWRRRRRA